MKAIGTVINKSGKTLALFQVKPELFLDPDRMAQYRGGLRKAFTHIPILLITLKNGEILIDGACDVVKLVKKDRFERYHWRSYDL